MYNGGIEVRRARAEDDEKRGPLLSLSPLSRPRRREGEKKTRRRPFFFARERPRLLYHTFWYAYKQAQVAGVSHRLGPAPLFFKHATRNPLFVPCAGSLRARALSLTPSASAPSERDKSDANAARPACPEHSRNRHPLVVPPRDTRTSQSSFSIRPARAHARTRTHTHTRTRTQPQAPPTTTKKKTPKEKVVPFPLAVGAAMSQQAAPPPWWDDGMCDLINRRAPMPSTSRRVFL